MRFLGTLLFSVLVLFTFLGATKAYSVGLGGLFPTHEGSGSGVVQDYAGTQHLHAFLMAIDEINANSTLLNNITLLSSVANTMRDQDQVFFFFFSFFFLFILFYLKKMYVRLSLKHSDCVKILFQMKVFDSSWDLLKVIQLPTLLWYRKLSQLLWFRTELKAIF